MPSQWIKAGSLALLAGGAWAAEPAPVLPVQAQSPDETLTPALVEQIVADAYASIGCALPTDLITVFQFYTLDRAMAHLGAPIGPERAQRAFFAARGQGAPENADDARLLEVARALDGQTIVGLRDGRLTQSRGMIVAEGCEPQGNVFALQPYDVQ